jgi:HK97 family phage major capsid protein
MTVTSTSWGGALTPPQVQEWLLNKLLTGSPFAQALTLVGTNRGSMVWPIVAPDGAAWVGEAQPIPTANLNDDVYMVAVCKLAAIIEASNESVSDALFPIATAIGRAIADSCGPVLDRSLLYGGGGLEPIGVFANAPAAGPAEDFRQAAIGAWGELAAAGALPENIVVFAHPVPIAAEWARVNAQGSPLHDDSPSGQPLTLGPGIRVTGVPMLDPADVLAVDTSMVFLVERDDVGMEMSDQPGWNRDTLSIRVKGRLTVAAPVPEKSMRQVVIGPPPPFAHGVTSTASGPTRTGPGAVAK